MKTSLNIDDNLFNSARLTAIKQKKTLGEIISLWARVGKDTLAKSVKKKTKIKSLKLGKMSISLNSRQTWMDFLDK